MTEAKQPQADQSDRERFLTVLNDITYAALESQNLDELMQLLADRLAEIINADGCFLTLWDPETRRTIPGAAYGSLRETYKEVVTVPNQRTLTSQALDAGKTLVIEDVWNSPHADEVAREFPTRGILAIPAQTSERKLGAALIGYERPHQFQPMEIEFCELAVGQVSLALGNFLSFEALKKSEQKYRKLAEALREREKHLDEAQTNAKIGSWEQIPEAKKLVWSPGLFRLFNLEPGPHPPSREEILAQIAEEDRAYIESILGQYHLAEEISPLEFRTIHGKHLFGKAFRDPDTGRLTGTIQDLTEQRRLEAELLQARKMETVGTLAGGIAHNFNNILTVIMGNFELLRSSLPDESSEYKILNQCLEATERAALLTRQLLVVSRTHDLKPERIEVNHLLMELTDLLAPLVGEHIHLKTNFCKQHTFVNADKGHLEQVVMNLILNARDVLGDGGNLEIRTEERQAARRYIVISVTDDGPGISKEHLPHIFDPFFTTKEEGKGTGLGLATVQSIVQQSRGEIEVASEPQQGTTFSIVLPAAASHGSVKNVEVTNQNTVPQPEVERQEATILLIEDHESLRDLARFVLEKAGYQVVTKERADDAMMYIQSDQPFDLVITDIQLPGGLTGKEIALQVTLLRGKVPVIFISGLRQQLPEEAHYQFLPKPFRPTELLTLVDKALGD